MGCLENGMWLRIPDEVASKMKYTEIFRVLSLPNAPQADLAQTREFYLVSISTIIYNR